MKTIDDAALTRWQQIEKLSRADKASWDQYAKEDAQRQSICKEMIELLSKFMNGELATDALREVFDKRTRNEWSAFGFKGMSGAMFLNKLVKHLPNETNALAAMLRAGLPVPADSDKACNQMRAFFTGLQGLVAAGKLSKAQAQAARVPFFVSAWWHVQSTEEWPVFYLSGRNVFQQQPEYLTSGDVVEDYFSFREYFLSLGAALKLDSWTLEHLLDWQNKLDGKKVGSIKGNGEKPPSDDADDKAEKEEEDEDESEDQPTHVQTQWLLAKIGSRLGCKVWIAANDHKRVWKGEKLGDLSIDALPTLGLDNDSQKVIGLIDVVWLKGTSQVAAAFEVEHTTSIYSGLLRMADLVAMSPNLNFPLYIVAPQARITKVHKQLSRPTFQTLELHKRCGYFSCEDLVQAADSIIQWASHSGAINKLAKYVEDVKA